LICFARSVPLGRSLNTMAFAGNSFSSPARDVVVNASASVLVGREVDSRPGLTKTL